MNKAMLLTCFMAAGFASNAYADYNRAVRLDLLICTGTLESNPATPIQLSVSSAEHDGKPGTLLTIREGTRTPLIANGPEIHAENEGITNLFLNSEKFSLGLGGQSYDEVISSGDYSKQYETNGRFRIEDRDYWMKCTVQYAKNQPVSPMPGPLAPAPVLKAASGSAVGCQDPAILVSSLRKIVDDTEALAEKYLKPEIMDRMGDRLEAMGPMGSEKLGCDEIVKSTTALMKKISDGVHLIDSALNDKASGSTGSGR